MLIGQDSAKGEKGRKPFALTFWLTIAVSLLSALLPLGPPESRTTGSAFSAATTSVAIRARAAAPLPAQQRIVPPPADPPPAIMAVPAMLILGPILPVVIVWGRSRGAQAHPFAVATFRRARAPPLSA